VRVALLQLRALGWTADPPLPVHLRDAYDRLHAEDDRLRVAGCSNGVRLAELVEFAVGVGIGEQVRGIADRATSLDAGVVVDRPVGHHTVARLVVDPKGAA
jgi:hypothetical protein